MIRFSCPRCRRVYDAPIAGMKFNCACGQRVQVPPSVAEDLRPVKPAPGRGPLLLLVVSAVAVLVLSVGALILFQGSPSEPKLAQTPPPRSPNELDEGKSGFSNDREAIETKSDKDKQGNPVSPEVQAPKENTYHKEKRSDVAPTPTPDPRSSERTDKNKPVTEPVEYLIPPFEALGPATTLDKIKVVQVEGKAHFVDSGNVNDLTATWQSIHQMKFTEKNPRLVDDGFLLKANRGWFWDGRQSRTLEGAGLSFYQNFGYSLALSNLLPLKEKGFDLEKEDALPVKGRDCYRFRVRFKGRPEMLLFFDSKTNLLCKSEFRGPFIIVGTLQLQNGDTLVENYFSNYRKAHGVNHWWKWEQYRDGRRYGEINLYNIEFLEEFDEAKLFSFPAGTSGVAPLGPGTPTLNIEEGLGQTDSRDTVRRNCRCKIHLLRMVAGKTYQIDMVTRTPGFDPYLRLEDAAGKQLAEDDDGGGFPNARIIFNCPETGNYRIICTSFMPAVGGYALTVRDLRFPDRGG
jgi:hypothetical protein